MTSRGWGEVLGPRALNRALLGRQMPLDRREASVLDAIEHLVGLQAQAPDPPYVGLWTRLAGFRPDELSRAIVERRAVRVALMRNTLHLVSARDCLTLRPLTRPAIERNLYAGRARRAALEGVDVGELVAAGRALLEERPLTAKELGGLLRELWPDHDAASLARAIRHPTVCGGGAVPSPTPRSKPGSAVRPTRTPRRTSWSCVTSARSDQRASRTRRPG